MGSAMHRRGQVRSEDAPVRSDRARSRLRSSGGVLLRDRAIVLAAIAACALVVGGALHVAGHPSAGSATWGTAVAVLSAELLVEVVWTVAVEHHMGVDVIALVAMVGALVLGQELAGLIVGLMYSGGATLEQLASARARRDLTALVQRAPKVARLRVGDDYRTVAVDEVVVGDIVSVRAGEVVPVDGTLASDEAVLDTSTLSGEPLPVTVSRGMEVLSGTANAGPPVEVRTERPASESAYAALVRLVARTQGQRAPFVRMADRYAGFFLPVTLAVAFGAWLASGDPVRALAVVVVATPCPLILAAPIAFVSGLSRAARSGVIVKGSGAIEALGHARTVLFDKTGTLTVGSPELREVIPRDAVSPAELLRLAASVDQLSVHVLGDTLARAAMDSGLALAEPDHVREEPGQGIEGIVDGRTVAVGSREFLLDVGVPGAEIASAVASSGHGSGEARVLVAADGHLLGVIVMADELRPDAVEIVRRLRAEGVSLLAMVSGDRRSVAERIGRELGIDRVYAELTPQDKLEVVRSIRARPELRPVVMVGDGVNDAPALTLADVGIAMGAAGATVSSETADAVVVVDRIDRVVDAVHAGRRSVFIARQSVLCGMGLSITAMGVAAAGYLPPVAGALLQEGIDLAVILNALRALRG
ncbi:MAG: heavy metal translocating P-type ATPase [Solirubrobacteraceae bacterium]